VDCEDNTILELSTPGIVEVSSGSNMFVFSEDNPNFKDPRDHEKVLRSNSDDPESDLDLDDNFIFDADLPSTKWIKDDVKRKKSKVKGFWEKYKKKSWKQRYDLTWRFQDVKVAKLL
jgi:hypothetical protein